MATRIRDLIIVGAGAFGREVLSWTEQAIRAGVPWRVKGFLDDRPGMLDALPYGDVAILESPQAYTPTATDLFLCAMGDPVAKRKYVSLLGDKGAEFGTLIHPTALIGRNVRIGAGSIICPYTQMSCDITLGRHVTLGTYSCVAHDTSIGDYAQVSGGCQLNGNVRVEEGAFLGSSATLLPAARVGAWAYVGAGSVVLRRVKPGAKVFGNPAQTIATLQDA